MKKLSLLRDWTKVLFGLAILPIIFLPGFLLLYVFYPDLIPVDTTILGSKGITWLKIIVIVPGVAGWCFFVYALYCFKKALDFFKNRKIFHDEVVILFLKVGNFIYYGLLLTVIPSNLFYILTQDGFYFDLAEFVNIIFVLTLGFFFTVLSDIFKKAKQLKEENDLTV